MATKWLSPKEMRGWRAFLSSHALLMAVLDRELQDGHGVTLADFEVLVHLSEAPEGGLRMADLAGRLVISRSGMTRRLDGLAARGWVERRPCASDRRGTIAALTPSGRRALSKVAPTHLDGVRRHFISAMSSKDLSLLADVLGPISDGLGQPASSPVTTG